MIKKVLYKITTLSNGFAVELMKNVDYTSGESGLMLQVTRCHSVNRIDLLWHDQSGSVFC